MRWSQAQLDAYASRSGAVAPAPRKAACRPEPTETQTHIAVAEHLRHRGVPGLWWTHPPNGEVRDKATGAKLKAMGTRPGTPDLVLLHAGRFYGLELKRTDGRLSPAQIEARASIENAGGYWAVAHGFDQALTILGTWGLLKSDGHSGAAFGRVPVQHESRTRQLPNL